MQVFGYFLLYPFIFIFSKLPLRVLYFLSDYLLYPVLYRLLGYRTKVVSLNINNSLPEYSDAQKLKIEKDFYHYLCDLFVETIKSFSASPVFLAKHVKYNNVELLDKFYTNNKSVLLTLGHIGNYEWIAKSISLELKHLFLVPYHEMSNPSFDSLFKKSRTAFGAVFFPTYETIKVLRREFERPILLGLANDQSAPPNKAYWTRFLNQDTSFFVGTEKMAIQFGYPVVFGHVSVKKRGEYTLTFMEITQDPALMPEGEIMKQHAQMLEKNILEYPKYWLWSHRRWKHEMPEGIPYGFNIVKRSKA